MWRAQQEFTLIVLRNNFFIARLYNKKDYDVALLNGPWVINDHYLRVQCWIPNFMPKSAKIKLLLVWAIFPETPVEYYMHKWLVRAGNRIGKTIRLDRTMFLASRGKFAQVCVEVDLTNCMKVGYKFRGVLYSVQYEELHEICFNCRKYGHRSSICPSKATSQLSKEASEETKEAPSTSSSSQTLAPEAFTSKPNVHPEKSSNAANLLRENPYESWTMVIKARRRPA